MGWFHAIDGVQPISSRSRDGQVLLKTFGVNGPSLFRIDRDSQAFRKAGQGIGHTQFRRGRNRRHTGSHKGNSRCLPFIEHRGQTLSQFKAKGINHDDRGRFFLFIMPLLKFFPGVGKVRLLRPTVILSSGFGKKRIGPIKYGSVGFSQRLLNFKKFVLFDGPFLHKALAFRVNLPALFDIPGNRIIQSVPVLIYAVIFTKHLCRFSKIGQDIPGHPSFCPLAPEALSVVYIAFFFSGKIRRQFREVLEFDDLLQFVFK